MGYNDFTSGTYSLSGSGLLSTNIEYLGYSGTGSFTQSGGTNAVSGSLCLAYTSGSSGTYNLNGGVLSIAALSQGNGAAAFNFGGGTLQAAGQFSTTVAMTLTGSGGNATVNTSGYAVTFSGNLSGPAGLVKTGNNALTLSGADTYGGGTVVNQGNLVFSSTSAIPASGLIQINAPGAVNISGAYTTAMGWLGSGKINAESTGALALTGSSNENINFSGYNTLSLGAVGSETYTGTITPASSGYNLGGGGGTLVYNGPALSGSNSLTINGNVILSGTNTYAGGTQVFGGTLVATTTAALPGYASAGTVSVAAGATLGVRVGGSGEWGQSDINALTNNANFVPGSLLGIDTTDAATAYTYSNNVAGSFGLNKLGGGALILCGTNTYNGPTIVSAGTLRLQAAATLPAGTKIMPVGDSITYGVQRDERRLSRLPVQRSDGRRQHIPIRRHHQRQPRQPAHHAPSTRPTTTAGAAGPPATCWARSSPASTTARAATSALG